MRNPKPPKSGARFEQRVAEILQKSGFPFKDKVGIGGVQTDFVVLAPHGRSIVVEPKTWHPTERNLNRAFKQVRLYQEAVGAYSAILVLEGLERGHPKQGVVGEHGLFDLLSTMFRKRELVPDRIVLGDVPEVYSFGKLPRASQGKAPVVPSSIAVNRAIFAAMPFSGTYDDTYFVAMANAANSIGAVCRRVDREDFQGDIVEEIKSLIRGSVAVIADLSESKPDVLYETGFAHALNLPTVHICSTPLSQLPFDVRNWNTISYAKGQTVKLREPLTRRLAALLRK